MEGVSTAVSLSDSRRHRVLLLWCLLFLAGAAVRTIDFRRPVATIRYLSWREGDLGGIARNFYREDMNILRPRVDWRGDGPGLAEMEFPLYSWTLAVLYKVFGLHDFLGRLLSYAISLVTMGVFFRFARDVLRPREAWIACAFYVLSPLSIETAATLQAEGLMFLAYLVAVHAFVRWLESGSWTAYAASAAATALAILFKAPAAHVGLLFAFLMLRNRGWRSALLPSAWFFAIIALLPGALWYRLAHGYFLTYGNSLGVATMHHWVDLDVFRKPQTFLLGILENDIGHVWMLPGTVVAALGLYFGKGRKLTGLCVAWLTAIGIYYVVTARTNGQDWAVYYHVIAVPPVALLIAMGADGILSSIPGRGPLLKGAFGSAAAAAASAVLGWLGLGGPASQRFYYAAGLLIVIAMALGLITFFRHRGTSFAPAPVAGRPWLFYVGAICLAAVPLFQLRIIYWDAVRTGHREHDCVEPFRPFIPENALIVASGFHERDQFNPAYSSPYQICRYFYWLDRKGWNISAESQSVETLEALVRRGARFYVAEKNVVAEKPGFEEDLRRTYPLLAECETSWLFRLERMSP